MTLAEVYSWATDTTRNATLKQQIASALAVAAVNVLAESGNTDYHLLRAAWAKSVLASSDAPLELANKYIWGVLGNPSIQASLESSGAVSDSDLQFTVNSAT
jgi:hypothetical protein